MDESRRLRLGVWREAYLKAKPRGRNCQLGANGSDDGWLDVLFWVLDGHGTLKDLSIQSPLEVVDLALLSIHRHLQLLYRGFELPLESVAKLLVGDGGRKRIAHADPPFSPCYAIAS